MMVKLRFLSAAAPTKGVRVSVASRRPWIRAWIVTAALVATATIGAAVPTAASAGTLGTPTELPGSTGDASLDGVSCVSATDCTAVGQDGDGAMYATETASGWGSPTPLSGTESLDALTGVSCASVGDCAASGYRGDGPPAYATEAGGSWDALTEPTGAGAYGELHGVSCVSAGDCTAVGGDSGPPGSAVEEPTYVTETDGTWATLTVLSGSPRGHGLLNAVSCVSAGDCTAVGYDSDGRLGDADRPVYATETDGTWGTPVELTGGAGGGVLYGVSCASRGDCTAVGQDGTDRPIYVTESDGAWGPVTVPTGTPRSYGSLEGVSCAAAGDCTAVGYDGDNATVPGEVYPGNDQPLYVTETGGAWGTPTELTGSPGGSAPFSAVSCVSAEVCTAVGQDGNGRPFYATGTAGSTATGPGGSGSGSPEGGSSGTSMSPSTPNSSSISVLAIRKRPVAPRGRLTLSCSAGNGCPKVTITVSVREIVRAHRVVGLAGIHQRAGHGKKIRTQPIGRTFVTVAAGHSATVTPRLNAPGRRLLRRLGRVRTTITVGAGGALHRSFAVLLRTTSKPGHRHR